MIHHNPFVSLAQTQLASRLVPFWGVSEAPKLFEEPPADELNNESRYGHQGQSGGRWPHRLQRRHRNA